MSDGSNKLLRLPEVAELTGVPIDTLRHWRNKAVGPPSARLGRRVVYRQADVQQWVDEQFRRDPGLQPSAEELERRLDADHDVFACICGMWHCVLSPAVHSCSDVGWHCEDADCRVCDEESAREFNDEQAEDIRRFGH